MRGSYHTFEAASRPHVLHVIGSMDPSLGGASQGLRDLLPLLDRAGSRNEVLCLDDSMPVCGADDGITFHTLGRPGNPWQYNPKLSPWLEARAKGYDAIVIHGLWLHHGMAVSKFIRRLRGSGNGKAPLLLVMPHGMLDPWFQVAPGRRLKAIRNRIYWSFVERSVLSSADALLFTAEEERERARLAFPGYPEVPERVVGFGTVTPPGRSPSLLPYPYSELPLGLGEPYLLFLGRIHEKKGIDLILDAYARLRSPQLPALLLAGPGWDSPYGNSLRMAVGRDAFLSGKVHFDGMLSGERKWHALHGCEALVHPSHHENFGVSVAEALACGRPVLLTDKVNIHREVVGAGAALCGPDTTDGMVSLLSRWLSMDEAARTSMSVAASDAFESRFRMDGCARRFLSVLRELMPDQTGSVEVSYNLCIG
jgi:glycosyltransferase involved in cell wall biosynthesis